MNVKWYILILLAGRLFREPVLSSAAGVAAEIGVFYLSGGEVPLPDFCVSGSLRAVPPADRVSGSFPSKVGQIVIVRLYIAFFSLLNSFYLQQKKPQVFIKTHGLVLVQVFFYVSNKKATGLEFARGRVTDLGKAKYQQAHSAQVQRYRFHRRTCEALQSRKMRCSCGSAPLL